MTGIKAYVFDAYGTLFDVHSVLARCEELFPGYGAQLSSLWRTRQLEYTWLRSLMGYYADFWQISRDALVYACQSLGISGEPEQIEGLMQGYLTLSPFADSKKMLESLEGTRCAVLSNGTPAMLEYLIRHAGLDRCFEQVLSVDAVKIYKPHPSVYHLAVTRLGVERHEIAYVSANGWDVVGAKVFGFRTYWLNRSEAPPETLGVKPDRILRTGLEI